MTTQTTKDYCEDCGQVEWLCICDQTRRCLDCGYKLDDGYTKSEVLCGACYNIENNIDQDFPMCGDHLVTIDQCNCKP